MSDTEKAAMEPGPIAASLNAIVEGFGQQNAALMARMEQRAQFIKGFAIGWFGCGALCVLLFWLVSGG